MDPLDWITGAGLFVLLAIRGAWALVEGRVGFCVTCWMLGLGPQGKR
jgi:hypothetical protein